MARAGHRHRHHEVQPSDWIARAYSIYQERRTLALVVVGILVAVPLAAGLFLRARHAADREAQGALARGEQEYYSGNLPAALTFYQDVLDRYGGTPSAHLAAVGRGRVLLLQNQPQQALAAFQQARDAKDPLVSAAARRGYAGALEDLHRSADAAHAYEALARDEKDEAAADELLSAARAWRAAGNAAAARADYTRVIEEYPKSQRVQEARIGLAELP